jgi:polyketide cyclase/dehydrase/lipid transport protein
VIRVERAIDVERSASEVFDRLVRIEDLPRWQPAISEAAVESPLPLRPGSRIRLVADVAGQRVVAIGTITELARPSRIGLVAKAGSADVQGGVTITPTGDATCRVALVTGIKLGGMLRFVEGVARSRIEAEAPAVAASVKQWLEADEPSAQPADPDAKEMLGG